MRFALCECCDSSYHKSHEQEAKAMLLQSTGLWLSVADDPKVEEEEEDEISAAAACNVSHTNSV